MIYGEEDLRPALPRHRVGYELPDPDCYFGCPGFCTEMCERAGACVRPIALHRPLASDRDGVKNAGPGVQGGQASGLWRLFLAFVAGAVYAALV